MPNFISDLYNRSEEIPRNRLYIILVAVLVVFSFLGIFIGYLIPGMLNKNEIEESSELTEVVPDENVQYEGKVVFIDPLFYPNDNISFYLADASGEQIMLLTASDEKLSVVEGLNVILFGKVKKTTDGSEEVLFVDKIVVSK